jgi:hypothetical protein
MAGVQLGNWATDVVLGYWEATAGRGIVYSSERMVDW